MSNCRTDEPPTDRKSISTSDARPPYSLAMKSIVRLLPLGLVFLGAAGEIPPLEPVRDVTVTYRVVRAAVEGGPAKLVIKRDASGTFTRIDSFIFADARSPYEGVIFDAKSNRILALLYARQLVLDSPGNAFALPGISLSVDMGFRREGTKTILGMPCTEWSVTPPKPDPAKGDPAKVDPAKLEPWTACVTEDGVLLRSASPTRELEALSVSYDKLPAAAFAPPPDLKRMTATPAKQPANGEPAKK